MPVKFGLWRVDGTQVQQVPATTIASEERLEEIIQARIEILGLGNLFQIGPPGHHGLRKTHRHPRR
jgi:hypothetical protein